MARIRITKIALLLLEYSPNFAILGTVALLLIFNAPWGILVAAMFLYNLPRLGLLGYLFILSSTGIFAVWNIIILSALLIRCRNSRLSQQVQGKQILMSATSRRALDQGEE